MSVKSERRPLDERRVHVRERVKRLGGVGPVGLVVEVEGVGAFITPARAFELADRLVDAAERAESLELSGGVE